MLLGLTAWQIYEKNRKFRILWRIFAGLSAKLPLPRSDMDAYPASAVWPIWTAPAVFSNLSFCCEISARSFPISSACCRMMASFLLSISSRYVGAVSCVVGISPFCRSISPIPLNSHIGDISGYTIRIFSNLSVPIAPCFFNDLPNEAFAIPMLLSNAAIEIPLKSMYCLIRSNIISILYRNFYVFRKYPMKDFQIRIFPIIFAALLGLTRSKYTINHLKNKRL